MIYEKTAAILANILNLEEEDIRPGMGLSSENEIEKIHIAKLVVECEKRFKVTIQDEKVHTFHTVKDLVLYIEEAIGENEGRMAESTEEERMGWEY